MIDVEVVRQLASAVGTKAVLQPEKRQPLALAGKPFHEISVPKRRSMPAQHKDSDARQKKQLSVVDITTIGC